MVYINDQFKIIFIENPKSGSTSILMALQKVLNYRQTSRTPEKAHQTCDEIKQQFPDKWKEYLKVSTFRDPVSRFISSMKFKTHITYYYRTEKEILNHFKINKKCVYCVPQEEFTNGCDVILHLDTLQEDFDKLCEKLCVKTTRINHLNSSHIKNNLNKIPKEILTKIFNENYN